MVLGEPFPSGLCLSREMKTSAPSVMGQWGVLEARPWREQGRGGAAGAEAGIQKVCGEWSGAGVEASWKTRARKMGRQCGRGRLLGAPGDRRLPPCPSVNPRVP